MSTGNTLAKCQACGAAISSHWFACVACDAPIKQPLHVLLTKGVEGTTMTPEEFRAELSALDVECAERGEVSVDALQTAARSMEQWRKWTKT